MKFNFLFSYEKLFFVLRFLFFIFCFLFFRIAEDFPFYATNLKLELATRNTDSTESGLYVRLLWNDKEISLPGLEAWTPVENLIRMLHAGFLGEEHPSVSIEESSETLNSLNELDSLINETLLSVDDDVDEAAPISKL